jgi:flagellar biosynthesis protein
MRKANYAAEFLNDNAITLRVSNAEDPKADNPPNDGQIAKQIVNSARQHRVKLRQDPALVEALAYFNVTDSIPPELYRSVAEILTFLQQLETTLK